MLRLVSVTAFRPHASPRTALRRANIESYRGVQQIHGRVESPSNKRRVTDFNNPKLKSFEGKTIIAADHSFSPDGRRFAAYLQTDLIKQIGLAVIIEMNPEKVEQL